MNQRLEADGSASAQTVADRLDEWSGTAVVIDVAHPFVAIGTLTRATTEFLELHDADLHDLRDTGTSRENYVVKVARHGIGVNRRTLIVRMDQVVGISPLDAVVDE